VNGDAPFLRAEWRDLAILNFEIEPVVLDTLVPRGLELDSWQGRHYISLIGFRFVNTRVLGVPIPFYRDFDEVNCRFYVRRRAAEGWRHGVVFIKELVPCRLVALAARALYNEPYVALPMRHRFEHGEADGVQVRSLTYAWTLRGRENRVSLTSPTILSPTREGSDAAFFAERYWGYAVQRTGAVLEYHVERPRWSVAAASEAQLACDVAAVYGDRFVEPLGVPPASAFFAAGSEVTLSRGVALAIATK
jgi:uncharacterized protein YqjF (DUF2071 family)